MRLKCAIVSRILAQQTAGDTLPAWVSRHVSHCDSCAAEAAAYALLQTAIKETAGPVEPLDLTWQELRSTLPAAVHCRRRVPVSAIVGAAAATAAAMMVGFFILPHGVTRPTQTVSMPQPAIRQTQVQPAEVVERNSSDTQPEVVPLADNRPSPKPPRRPIHPPRLQVKHSAPAPPSVVDNDPNMVAQDTPPDPPVYRVVGAEEHVINVVGATPVGAPETSDTADTDYVIRHTDTGDARPVLL